MLPEYSVRREPPPAAAMSVALTLCQSLASLTSNLAATSSRTALFFSVSLQYPCGLRERTSSSFRPGYTSLSSANTPEWLGYRWSSDAPPLFLTSALVTPFQSFVSFTPWRRASRSTNALLRAGESQYPFGTFFLTSCASRPSSDSVSWSRAATEYLYRRSSAAPPALALMSSTRTCRQSATSFTPMSFRSSSTNCLRFSASLQS
mmetsp:Transcript_7501/g.31755  ORF Transcript_7501/g.31755 Transcript_7501/m.31755 type:complete len:205 (-) Transcript_7501:113-727(-)